MTGGMNCMGDVWVNEIHYDNTGADANEGVEVAGPAGTDLTGYRLVGYNGNNGASYLTKALSGTIDDEGEEYGALWFDIVSLQNGAPDGIALVDSGSNVLQFLSYEGAFTAVDGPANGMTGTDIAVAESGITAIGESLQLTGTGSIYNDFAWIGPTNHSRGNLNSGQTIAGGPVASNQPPAIALAPDYTTPSVNVSNLLTFTVTATEVPADIAQTIDLPQPGDLPAGATFPPTNGLSPLSSPFNWTPVVTGIHVVTFTASDPDGTTTQEVTITVNPPPELGPAWINEIHYDNTGGDQDEGVEVAGPAGADLTGYQLVAYNGNNGVSYHTKALSGTIDNEGEGYGALWFYIVSLQNGAPDGIALVDSGSNVLQFLSYEGTFTAVGGPANTMVSSDIGLAEGGSTPLGNSLQLIGIGTGYAAFTWTGPVNHSRGDVNEDQIIGSPTNRPPMITIDPDNTNPYISAHEQYSITVTATEPDSDTITLTCSNMPDGAVLAPATNIGISPRVSTFTWTPDATGTFYATFMVGDDVQGDGDPVAVTFDVHEPGVIVTGLYAFINEVLANGYGEPPEKEFVEVVAPAGVNLEDCYLVHYNGDGFNDDDLWSFTFPYFLVPDDGVTDSNGVSLGFAVVSRAGSTVQNTDFSFTGELQNSDDGLILYDSDDNILDAVAWGGPGDMTFDDPGTVTTNGPSDARNYLHVTPDDDPADYSLQAPNDVRSNDGSSWATNMPSTPGAVNGNQTSGDLSVTVFIPAPTGVMLLVR